MATKKDLRRFICPDCGCDEGELEQDWEEGELISEDIVCNNCGYREVLY